MHSIQTARLMALVAAAAGVWACGSQPLPKVAVEGTTITVMVPNFLGLSLGQAASQDPANLLSDPSFTYDPANQLENPQFGESVFSLYDAEGVVYYGYLPVRYTTRVASWEGSPGAIDEAAHFPKGQTLILLDLPFLGDFPLNPSPGEFRIKRQVWRRNEETGVFEAQPLPIVPPAGSGTEFAGWGGDIPPAPPTSPPPFFRDDDPEKGIPIYIVASPTDPTSRFTDKRGWDLTPGYNQAMVSGSLAKLVPFPEATLWVPFNATESSPAAWEMVIEYPLDKVGIRGVSLKRSHKSSGLVRWQARDSIGNPDDPDAPAPCGSGTGSLSIQVLDPDEAAAGVEIAYSLRNFPKPPPAGSCGGRADASTFSIVDSSFRAFNADGNPISVSKAINAFKF